MFVDQQGFIATLVYTEPFVATNNLANMRCMPETPEQQLKGFIAKFDPVMGKQIRECRSAMRKRFPTANELLYDNYNFFVIGYCTTERPLRLCRIAGSKFQRNRPESRRSRFIAILNPPSNSGSNHRDSDSMGGQNVVD
jgi:hypothetical protein